MGGNLFSEVYLENFQGFGENESAKLAPITLILGANSSGKSSVGRALRLLKQSLLTPESSVGFRYWGSEIEFITSNDCIRGRRNSQYPSTLRLGVRLARDIESIGPVNSVKELALVIAENMGDGSVRADFTCKGLHNGAKSAFVASVEADTRGQINILGSGSTLMVFPGGHGVDYDDALLYLLQSAKSELRIAGGIPRFRAPDGYSDFFEDLASELKEADHILHLITEVADSTIGAFQDFKHIEPMRPIPKKYSVLDGPAWGEHDPRSTGVYEDFRALLYKMTDGRYSPEYHLKRIADFDAFVEIQAVRDNHTNITLGLDQVGVGISQVIPILESVCYDLGTTYIEQPELHLHPKMQAELMSNFVDSVNKNPGRQYILETHSESMLLRLQKCVRDGIISKEQVQILFCNKSASDAEDKVNLILPLEMDSSGDLVEQLPDSFMDIRMQDLF